ncbi:proton-conducting transporter membrane subunit [Isoptericola sp. b441]|uniref:Proton-conducting transporter membrane subunit n=1 Tax=Actinotalea lenta TaxID=3064654 RepID=A0ABT9DE34_9CELL|nr:proton-conducting transporter membrane subunit [Isoptericola sp. b441]MDO8107623.1 proton-conducting transporter membrane subunit [Isoptericola sp. b441]
MSGGSLLALVALPALGGAGLLGRGAARARTGHAPARDRTASGIALATASLSVALGILVSAGRPVLTWSFIPGGAFALGVDGLTALLLPGVLAVALLVLVAAAVERTEPAARFHGLMLLFVAAVAVTLTATSLPALLLGWELMGAASWSLIGFRWRDPERTSAGVAAFVTTRTADLGLYLAAGAAAAGSASDHLGLGLEALPDLSSPWRQVVAVGVVVAALGKAAQLPFSVWLSKAMLGPSPVSALLHSAAMVAMGGYLLLRVEPLLAATPAVASAAAWTGAVTTVVLGVVAMAQQDLKQLLAASTSAQLGFVVLAAGVGDAAGGTEHLLGHAGTKALLFLVAGLWLTALGTKQLEAMAGAARWWRAVGVLFTLAALTLAGLPPLGLWVTKDHVLAAAAERSGWLYGVALIGAVLSAGYAAVALRAAWRGPERRPTDRPGWDSEEPGDRHVPRAAVLPLAVLAGGALAPVALLVPAASDAVDALLGVTGAATPGAAEMALSAALAVTAFGLVLRRVPRPVPGAVRWFDLDRAAAVLVVTPVETLAARADRLDRALDRAVAGTARATTTVAAAAARLDVSGVDGAVRAVAGSVRAAGRATLRPQSGLVHQYLGAAAVVLAVGAVLLVVVRP